MPHVEAAERAKRDLEEVRARHDPDGLAEDVPEDDPERHRGRVGRGEEAETQVDPRVRQREERDDQEADPGLEGVLDPLQRSLGGLGGVLQLDDRRLLLSVGPRLLVLDGNETSQIEGASTAEVNAIIAEFIDDYASVRRYLVDHGLMDRQAGIYWRL